jgi:hypothetical protein
VADKGSGASHLEAVEACLLLVALQDGSSNLWLGFAALQEAKMCSFCQEKQSSEQG